MPRKPLASRKQQGQALIFITVMLAVVLLALVTMYSVGQLATSKMKLQNTADAAVYSGALTEARDYNFSAYANRAMVANQVAVSQIVGLTSWARNYDDVFHGEFSEIALTFADLSELSAMWTTVWETLGPVAEGLKEVMDSVGPFLTKALDYLIDALSYGSYAYHLATLATLPQTIEAVVKANDPDAEVDLSSLPEIAFAAAHLYDWYKFTARFDPTVTNSGSSSFDGQNGGSQDRFANVTQFASNDQFAKIRGGYYPWPLPLLIDPTKFIIPFNDGTAYMQLWHTGGTELKTGGNTNKRAWTALDATGLLTWLVFWIVVPPGIPLPAINIIIPTPAGHGAAQAYKGASANLSPTNDFNHNAGQAYGGAYVDPLTAIAAAIQLGEGPGTGLDTNAGLKKYMDVKDRRTTTTNLHGPGLALQLKKDSSKIATSNQAPLNIGQGGGDLYLPDGMAKNQMKALSKAESYFARPTPRSDGKTEYGSLYNPYWQAHLIPNSILEQGASILEASLP